MKESRGLIGLAGEYYVCAELCRQGILALITPKNNPLFDIVATSPESKRTVSIQVKTMSIGNEDGWRLGKDMLEKKHNDSLFVVLVNMNKDGSNDFYIYPYDELVERVKTEMNLYMETPKKDGTPRKDTGFCWFDLKQFKDSDKVKEGNWKILGF